MATLKDAIQWIADNDDDSEMDTATISQQVTVVFVADLWGKDSLDIAKKIVKIRSKAGIHGLRGYTVS